jgi:hypothetical protein
VQYFLVEKNMAALVLTIATLIMVFFVQKGHPFLAGLIAVIPVKIIATSFMAHESGGLIEAVRGMLVGQFLWGFILLGVYLCLK